MHYFYGNTKKDEREGENLRMIETVVKLIKNDLKLEKTDLALYPSAANLPHVEEAVTFLTESLQIFLKTTMSGQNTDLKVASIGHAMMQAAWPNLPQHGMGVLLPLATQF